MGTPEQDQYLKDHLKVDVAKRRADAAPRGGGGFVPELDIPWTPTNEIDVNQTVILTLKIRNWKQAPKGTKVSWGESTSGEAVDIASEHHDGGGSVKVTGKAVGKAKVRAEVKIGEGDAGRSYSFDDTEFVVRGGVPASAFVPDLDTPYAPRLLLGVGQSVPLKLKIRNWGTLATGVVAIWGMGSDAGMGTNYGDVVKLSFKDDKNGEATVTVTGASTGKATVRASVRIGVGGSQPHFFADTAFEVKQAVDPNDRDPNSSPNQGGVANATNLEEGMYRLLDQWKDAAKDGVNEFVASALNKRINDLSSGSASDFVQTLLGAMIWATACFPDVKGIQFAISVVGIAVGAAPSMPSEVSDTFVPDTQRAMIDLINSIFNLNNDALHNKAEALLESEPDITLYHALSLFVEASFKDEYFSLDATRSKPPKLNASAMTKRYAELAKQMLDKAIEDDKARKLEKKKKALGYPTPPEEA